MKGLTGDRDKDATAIAKMVVDGIDDYRRIIAPEWPGTIEYTPQQVAQYISRGAQDKSMQEQLSEFGAWREQVMGVEARNGGNIRLLLDCIATCERLKLVGQKTLEQLVAEQFAPDRHRRRWEKFGIARPYVWTDKLERDKKADVMKVEFELLPGWLRGTRFRGSDDNAPRQRRETQVPERLGGYYEPDDEDTI